LNRSGLGLALRNLTDNARHHARSRVDVRVYATRDHAVIEIEDDGPGFPAADRERIFERFSCLGDIFQISVRSVGSARSLRGGTRARIASTARSDQVGFGAPTWRRNSATSYRNTKISASFAASDRANSTSHANTREAKR
jgi:Histidine kinase-, DNA gyrase B-, and HSP90-like ATPase